MTHVWMCMTTCTRRDESIPNLSNILEKERQTRRDEIAIDLEDRNTKKGTPPVPTETGDIRDLRNRAQARAI